MIVKVTSSRNSFLFMESQLLEHPVSVDFAMFVFFVVCLCLGDYFRIICLHKVR